MSVRDTSAEAYFDHRDSGALGKQAVELLKAFQPGRDYSRAELAVATGIRLSAVCGRVNELVKLGVLAEAPVRPCKQTGRTIHPVFRAPIKDSTNPE